MHVDKSFTKIQARVRPPPPSRQCLYFGTFWSRNPSLVKLLLQVKMVKTYTIPRVKTNNEKEARERRMRKNYLPRKTQEAKEDMKALADKKGISEKKLKNGSKSEDIKRMSQKEITNRMLKKKKGKSSYYDNEKWGQ